MNPQHPLKHLRISRAAVAKILWTAIEAGADAATLRAIRDYIADPEATPPPGIDHHIYAQAVAETDRAARRSRSAREAAARRRSGLASRASSAATSSGPEVKSLPEPDPDPHGIRRFVAELNAPRDSIFVKRKWGLL